MAIILPRIVFKRAAGAAIAVLLLPAAAQSPPEGQAPEPKPGERCREVKGVDEVGKETTYTICQSRLVGITGGRAAPVGMHPWQAQIYSTYRYTKEDIRKDKRMKASNPRKAWLAIKPEWERVHRCGGVYIGQGWVLTAAHCVTKAPADFLQARRVRLGTSDLAHPAGDYAIEAAAIHKDYEEVTHANDIALVKVAVSGSDGELGIRPIALLGSSEAHAPLAAGEAVQVTGWGLTRPMRAGSRLVGLDGKVQRASAVLKQVDLEVRDREKCDALYAGMTARMICAGSDRVGDDACANDSGGPMVRRGPDGPVLVGIVSRGKGCGLKDTPGVYTRVSEYRDWIEQAKTMPLGAVTRM